MGHTHANKTSHELATDKSIPWMGPVSTPREESSAVETAQAVSIDAARRRRTTSYGELCLAADESTGMKIGQSRFAEPAMSVIRPG